MKHTKRLKRSVAAAPSHVFSAIVCSGRGHTFVGAHMQATSDTLFHVSSGSVGVSPTGLNKRHTHLQPRKLQLIIRKFCAKYVPRYVLFYVFDFKYYIELAE